MAKKDNFSIQADLYVKYRPHYPAELYDYLRSAISLCGVAWDCGTGNGQVAMQLSRHFKKIYATDISQRQLHHAKKAKNIDYIVSPAEKTTIPPATVDLVTVAQAIHWFDLELFYKEVLRVGKPGAVLSYWGYNLPNISQTVDSAVKDFHNNVVGPFWDPEREILLNEYSSIKFPLQNVQRKNFKISVDWDLDQFAGYINSWSSVQKYIKENNTNPVEILKKELKKKWIDNQQVSFPVFMTFGTIS